MHPLSYLFLPVLITSHPLPSFPFSVLITFLHSFFFVFLHPFTCFLPVFLSLLITIFTWLYLLLVQQVNWTHLLYLLVPSQVLSPTLALVLIVFSSSLLVYLHVFYLSAVIFSLSLSVILSLHFFFISIIISLFILSLLYLLVLSFIFYIPTAYVIILYLIVIIPSLSISS